MRLLYFIYLIEWKKSHKGKGFKGCSPACYEEWISCEFKDMMRNPSDYKNNWYYFLIDIQRNKWTREF